MSILIKGMEMPKCCDECPFCDYEQGNCIANNERNTLPHDGVKKDWCPLVEVPKHGRLIDADALMSTIKEHDYCLYDRLTDTTKPGMFTFGIEYAVCTAPTIIEAEE